MTLRVIVTGTDTDIGKTVFAAGLTQWLDAAYWKPVQAGLDGETDTQVVTRLAGLTPDRIIPEAWKLRAAASPHLSSEYDRVTIDAAALELPETARPLVIEGAGGLMVPLTRESLLIDVFARWHVPVVLCTRTSLGTLNHTLLSLEALRSRRVPILGVALLGDPHKDNERTLAAMGRVPILGRLPRLDPLNALTLRATFADAFASTLGNTLGSGELAAYRSATRNELR